MPRESLRSSGYKSFITCNDPNGVVECGSIRKYKNNSGKKIVSRKTKEVDTISVKKAEDDKMIPKGKESCQSKTVQVSRVLTGAQKLKQVIDSWPSESSFEGDQSNDIAKDLLKGALDLQECLVRLGKLQESSRLEKTSLVKHKKEKFRIENCVSDGYHEPPRVSVDKPSDGDYIEELRGVIQESFARQKLLHNTGRKSYSDPSYETPSTSTSRYSAVCKDNDVSSTESSVAYETQSKKAKPQTNLIAKLMGLEQFSSKNVHNVLISSRSKTIFEIDTTKLKKPPLGLRKMEEVLKTVQIKDKEQRRFGSPTPIVLIKPRRERSLTTDKINKKTKAEEYHPVKKLIQKEGDKDLKKIVRKPEEKEFKIEQKTFSKTKKEVVNKNVEKWSRTPIASKKPVNVTPKKPKKIEDKSHINQISGRKTSDATKTQQSSEKKRNMKKNKKPTETKKFKEYEKFKDLTCEENSGLSEIHIQRLDKFNSREETDSYEFQIADDCISLEIFPCGDDDDTLPLSYKEDDFKTIEEVQNPVCHNQTAKFKSTETSLKSLLLNTPSFLTRIQNIYDLPNTVSNQRLLVDCASEVIEQNTLLLPWKLKSNGLANLDQLLDKVCEKLRRDNKVLVHENNRDRDGNLVRILERDVSCGSGMWDLGWRNRFFSTDVTEEVVNEIEKLILSRLIEEIIVVS